MMSNFPRSLTDSSLAITCSDPRPFDIHLHHHHQMKGIPKGCVAIMVGHEGEEQKKFIIPVMYINHPLFMQLLKEAEEEYGFHHEGPINIPCHVDQFCTVQGIIDKDEDKYQHHHACCFKA